MASFTVLRDISETLKKLIKQNIPLLSDENSIIFDSPGEMESTTSVKLSVFLYQMMENTYLRNAEPIPLDTTQMKAPPLTVDLFYLFTPYAKDRETELIILERLSQIFNDIPVLKDQILQGNLKESGNEIIRVVSNSLTLEELNKLWSTFPNKVYKLSVSYMLTPVRIPSERVKGITRVIEKDINFYLLGDKK